MKNLWPKPWYLNVGGKEMGAHQKDQAENKTHRALCAGNISLKDAQQQIVQDWTVLYQRFVSWIFRRPHTERRSRVGHLQWPQ